MRLEKPFLPARSIDDVVVLKPFHMRGGSGMMNKDVQDRRLLFSTSTNIHKFWKFVLESFYDFSGNQRNGKYLLGNLCFVNY